MTQINQPAQPQQNQQSPQQVQVESAPPSPGGKETGKDARQWAMWCHLAGLAGLVPLLPVIGSIIAPLIIWQIKKNDYPFVDEQGKEVVNFQISMLIYALAGSAACLITCIGIVLIPIVVAVVGLTDLILLLIAAVKANNGEHYRYPLTIHFIK